MKTLREHWRPWLAIVAGWTLFGLVYTFHYYYYAHHYVEIFTPPPTLREMLVWEMPYWLLWAALSPLVFYLARRFRLERGRLFDKWLYHIPACVALALAHRAIYLLIGWMLHVANYRNLASLYEVYNQNFFFNLPNGFMCYATILLVARLKTEMEEAQIQMERAQLQALKMQLHPHFLCNALQCISDLLHEDTEAADEMLARLGYFLRLTLDHSDEQEVTLQQELEYVGCYLEIQQARFHNRLAVEREVEPETLAALVPSLILQPLVENAVKHGIAARVQGGRIRIRASRRERRLCLEVEDDGPGLQRDAGARGEDERGLGLRNTRERLEHLYGNSQRLHLSEAPGGGLRVTLELPCTIRGDSPAGAPLGREGQVAVT